MNAATPASNKQYRLARHYLEKLRSAKHIYQRGDENASYGLKLAQQDWAQIQYWQSWSTVQAAQDQEAASLCSAYSLEAGELLDLLLSPQEHRHWRQAALIYAQQIGDQPAELEHLLMLGQIYHILSAYNQAVASVQQALEIARQLDNQKSIARGLTILGETARFEGKYAQSQAYHEQSLAIYSAVQDPSGIAHNLLGIGNLMQDLVADTAARPYIEEALHIYRQLGDMHGTATALRMLAETWMNEDIVAAWKYLDECLPLFKRLNVPADFIAVTRTRAMVLVSQGDFEHAQMISKEGLQFAQQLQLPRYISAFLMDLGGQASNQGNLEDAYAYYEQALEVARSEGRFWPITTGLLMLNSIAIRQRQFLAALAYAQEAFIVAQEHDHNEFMALSLFQVAFANIALGIIDAALNPLREIISMIQAANAPALGLGLAGCMSYLYLKTDRAEKGAELYRFIEGRPLPYNWIHYANLVEEELRAALGTEAFMTAFTHGKLLELDTVVAEIITELQA